MTDPNLRRFAGGQSMNFDGSSIRYRSSSFVNHGSRDSLLSNVSDPFARTPPINRQIRMAQLNLSHLADKVLEHSDIDGDPAKLERYVEGYVAEKAHISDLEKQRDREQNPSLLDRMRNR